jgi:hypothetical protein
LLSNTLFPSDDENRRREMKPSLSFFVSIAVRIRGTMTT